MQKQLVMLSSFVCLGIAAHIHSYAQTESIEHAVYRVNQKRENVNCVYYKAEGTLTFLQSDYFSLKGGGSKKMRESDVEQPLTVEALIDFDTSRFQIFHNTYRVHTGFNPVKVNEYKEFWSYDRNLFYQVKKHSDRTVSSSIGRKPLSEPILHHNLLPTFVVHGFVPFHYSLENSQLFDRQLSADDFVERREERFNGKKCTVLRSKVFSDGNIHSEYREIWIDRENWNILRIDTFADKIDHCHSSLEIEYKETNGATVLSKYKVTDFGLVRDRPASREMVYEIAVFQLNPDYDSLRHEFDLENGVRLRDK